MAPTRQAIILWISLISQNVLADSETESDTVKGYSRIFVASPGVRKYTYDIAHDPEGRDFSINFNPLDTGVDEDNFLSEPQPRYPAQYTSDYPSHYNPGPEFNDQVELKVKTPSHQQIKKISKDIQNVHSAYSKQPLVPTKSAIDDFDLGFMGYGDFMDSHDYEVTEAPIAQSTPKPKFPTKFLTSQRLFPKPIQYKPVVKLPYVPATLKYSTPTVQGLVQKVPNPQSQYGLKKVPQAPKLQYGFTPITVKPMVQAAPAYPSFDDDHLKSLADKAFSRMFLYQGHSNVVPRMYSNGREVSGRDFSKTLFVPVILMPGTNQVPAGRQNLRSSPPQKT